MKTCGKCKWYEPWSVDQNEGICTVPEEKVILPACYSLIKRDAWADMDFDCPFWDEK